MTTNGAPSESQFSMMNTDWSSVVSAPAILQCTSCTSIPSQASQNGQEYHHQPRYPAITMPEQAPSANNTLSLPYQQHQSRPGTSQSQTNHHVHYQQQLQLSPVPSSTTMYAPAMLSPTPSTMTAITAPTVPVVPLQVSTFVPVSGSGYFSLGESDEMMFQMSVTALASPVLAVQQPLSPVQFGTL